MDGRGYRGVPNRLAVPGMWAVAIRRGNTFPMLAIRWTEIFPRLFSCIAKFLFWRIKPRRLSLFAEM